MAVMDFREGGYVFSRHKVKREFSYDQGGWDGQQADGQRAAPGSPDGGDSLTARFGRLTHYLGAVASVGLMVGLMVWGWQLVSRDVSGIPVIRAIAGDSRSAPTNPGGELTSYTGYAVNNVAEGTEHQPTQQVAIAPAPAGLSDEDVAMGQLGAEAREPSVTSEVPLSFAGDPILPLSDSEARAQAAAAAEAQRLALADSAVIEAAVSDAPASEGPVNEALTDENGAPTQADAIVEALSQAQVNPGVLTASSRPAPRPRSTLVASAGTTATDARPVPAAERSASAPAARPETVAAAPQPSPASSSSAGGPQVQLGAFDSDTIAAKEWNRLMAKHVVFGGKQQVIQQHQSNGRTFWRLRVAGFGSLSEARQFCTALKSAGTDCLALN